MVFKSRIFSARISEEIYDEERTIQDAQIMAVLKQAEGGVPVSERAGSTE